MPARLLPPGPPDRFFIGNFPLGARRPLDVLTRWAREYGDIFYYRFLNLHVYFLNRPEYIEDVLVTNFRKFKKGRGLESNRRLFGNGLLTSEGEFWRRERRLCQPAFHPERIQAYAQVMVAFAERMLATWQDGEMRDAHKDMMRVTLEIVAKVLFGAEV
ncbi:MAG: cytochrome P450, partial [Acidobacteriia bacterium]|nr:cytochrome P450 [Terriglobia bacterium]